MKFVLFDAYGTLVELDDFYTRLKRGFEEAGVLLPADVVRDAARSEMKFYIANTIHARTEADWLALKHQCARVLADSIREKGFNLPLSVDEVLDVLNASLVFHVFPEARQTLDALQERGVHMGVLSNWDGSLRHVLRDLELIEYFDFILVSAEAGIQKPAREFFEVAIRKAQAKYSDVAPQDCYYVGDHYDGDVEGARGANMIPVWLVRDERDLASGEMREDDEVLRIRDLRELVSIV